MPADEVDYQLAHTVKIEAVKNRRRVYIDGERFFYATQGEITIEEFKTPSGKVFNNVVWIGIMTDRVEVEGDYHVNIKQGEVEFINETINPFEEDDNG